MNENLPDGDHDYHFVGRVGLFCPIKPGCGGGELVREGTDKDGNIIPTYIESEITVTQSKIDSNLCEDWSIPENY